MASRRPSALIVTFASNPPVGPWRLALLADPVALDPDPQEEADAPSPAEGSTSSPFWCDVEACVDLIASPDPSDPAAMGFVLYGFDDSLRVVLVEMAIDGAATLAIVADPDAAVGTAEEAEFLAQTQAVIDSITFE